MPAANVVDAWTKRTCPTCGIVVPDLPNAHLHGDVDTYTPK